MRSLIILTIVICLIYPFSSGIVNAETASTIIYNTIRGLEISDWPSCLQGWKRDKSAEPDKFDGKPKPEEASAGVVVFNRNWCFYTFVRSIPRDKERITPFSIKVTPGESEPMSVSLYCLENLNNVKAKVTDAGVIPASAWTTYTVILIRRGIRFPSVNLNFSPDISRQSPHPVISLYFDGEESPQRDAKDLLDCTANCSGGRAL